MSGRGYNKFYHNDIKKQLGIDESRTASEKLLDKVIKVDKRADFYEKDHQQEQVKEKPHKKVKVDPENEKPQSNKDILENKLMKNIENQTNVSKLLKSLTIFKKCLNQQSFLNDPEIDFSNQWEKYSEKLINEISERNYCSVESFNIMSTLGDCLQILVNKFGNLSREKDKIQENENEQGEVNEKQEKVAQKLILDKKMHKVNVFVWFCRLFTDDSFIFNKYLVQLKTFIFSHFESNSSQQLLGKDHLLFKIINLLPLMPIKFQWAHSSLVNLFKEFNNQGYQNHFPSDSDKKTYLKSFNELLNRKPKSSTVTGSYNMMGNSGQTAGLKTVHIQTNLQTSSDKWVSKQ